MMLTCFVLLLVKEPRNVAGASSSTFPLRLNEQPESIEPYEIEEPDSQRQESEEPILVRRKL